ncbi:MAG TPA: hypothetical protein VFZ63_16945 [Jiangellaceae bacterium]
MNGLDETPLGQHDDCNCGDEGPFVFDEHGQLVDDQLGVTADLLGRRLPGPMGPVIPPGSRARACPLQVLNGSWLIQITPRPVGPVMFRSEIRGPMRIQVGPSSLLISGDIYVRRISGPPFGPPFGRLLPHLDAAADVEEGQDRPGARPGTGAHGAPRVAWYPQLPGNEYSWYFRSTGVTYQGGVLSFTFVRHLWDRISQEFISTDTGSIELRCRRPLANPGGLPSRMAGTATIGGRRHDVRAVKTSNLYRGCRVEVDAMTNRTWPASAVIAGGVTTTFQHIYASAGWDVPVTVDEINVPEDASLTNAELQTLLATHRGPGTADAWRLWLLVGSAQGGLFGIMFDQDAVPREGAVGFADATLGNLPIIEAGARNRPLDEVPAAFLRTLVHEAGHALNLFHPKHDVHAPPVGIEIMNQTGDVMGFATAANPYPGNAGFNFAPHDVSSLVHSPDPQVRPGWKPFGWGHGSLSAGLPAPTDAEGFVNEDDTNGLRLEIRLPEEVFVGEYITADVVVTNVSDAPREVSTRLNLAEGDLRMLHIRPDGDVEQVRDIVVACGPRETTTLPPGESLTGRMQVFFTSEGVTFEEPGKHQVRAEFDVDGYTAVRSPLVTVWARTAVTETEREIASAVLDAGVGRAFALGDFGRDDAARTRLATLAEERADSDTGAAAALVLANAFARAHVDYRDTDATRDADAEQAKHYLDLAAQGRSAEDLVRLAATVASPIEREAPVVADALTRAKRGRKRSADITRAEAIAEDFVTPAAR